MRINDWSSDVCSSDLLTSVGYRRSRPSLFWRTHSDGGTKQACCTSLPSDMIIDRHGTIEALTFDEELRLLNRKPCLTEERHLSYRSEELRVVTACVITSRTGCSPYKKKKTQQT